MFRKRIDYENVLWMSVIIFAILDLISTYVGLSMGLVEENAVGVYLLETTGFTGMVIAKTSIILFCYKLSEKLMFGRWNYFTPFVLFFVWFLATTNNMFFIVKVY